MQNKDILLQYREQINRELDNIFSGLKPEILYHPMYYAIKIGGKRLRPIICQIAYKAAGGKKSEVLFPALAIELLHTFTLVHDDIMDNDTLRRGNPTVHTKWDLATGVLAGDGLISLAYRVLRKEKYEQADRILQIFTDGVIEVCEGQGLDKDFETRTEVTEAEYLDMINKKTATLLAVPCQIGAACACADPEFIETIGSYARALGLAFQIQDDLLDICSDEATLGKNIGSDIQAGKKTFLYIKALELIKNSADRQRYLDILASKSRTQIEVEEVRSLYEKYGVILATQQESANRIQAAEKLLNDLSNKYDISEIRIFNNYLLNRTF